MATFIKISTITVGSGGAASIDFTSIPATYTDLKIVCSLRSATNQWANLQFNGSSADLTLRYLMNNSGTVSSSSGSSPSLWTMFPVPPNTYTANTFGSAEIYIPNYASANYKSVSIEGVEENNSASNFQLLTALLWSQTAAINRVVINNAYGNFMEFSSATLYGIKSS